MPQRTQVASAPPGYRWIFDLLFGITPTVTWAAVGQLPPGYQAVDRFVVLPAGADRAFAVSLASRSGASSALTSYNALRSRRRRFARRVMGAGLRTGIAQRLQRWQVDIGVAVGATPRERADALLWEHLGLLFGRPVIIAFGCGGGPYRKPVLQVFGTDGAALGYVKIGWNDWTRDAVRREAAALTAGADRAVRFGVPALLRCSSWSGLDLVVTAPLPRGITRYDTDASLPGTDVLREISALSPVSSSELARSPWWLSLRERIKVGVADPDMAGWLSRMADGVERQHGRAELPFGRWHGDFVPWNLARLGGRLYAWDWESSAQSAPVGFDALHFHFQVAFVGRQRPVEEAAALAAGRARPALGALGVPPGQRDLLAPLHLLELTVRHEEARSSSGDRDMRFLPAVLPVIERGLATPPSVTVLHSAASSS